VSGPIVGIVVAEIEGDEVEVDPAVVERIALGDHRLTIPSFFEIKESDGGESFPKRIGSVFFKARADFKLERGKRTEDSAVQIT
jgi:hypothetical protein